MCPRFCASSPITKVESLSILIFSGGSIWMATFKDIRSALAVDFNA